MLVQKINIVKSITKLLLILYFFAINSTLMIMTIVRRDTIKMFFFHFLLVIFDSFKSYFSKQRNMYEVCLIYIQLFSK